MAEVPSDQFTEVEVPSELDERLIACLEQMRQDFDRGIVMIDEKGTAETFLAALKVDKTAGKNWDMDIEPRLLANDAALLKKAAAMPEGACLIGVYSDGTLAIRQRSQEIVNARWTEDWEDGDPESARGELLLLPHAEALARPRGRWAKAVEIVRAVRGFAYHLPADPHNYEKEGLVAASEAVTGGYYLMGLNGKESRTAILECDENVPDDANVWAVDFNSSFQQTYGYPVSAYYRTDRRGAVLWLRG